MSIVMRLNVSSYINQNPFVILYVTHAVIRHIPNIASYTYTVADVHVPYAGYMSEIYRITEIFCHTLCNRYLVRARRYVNDSSPALGLVIKQPLRVYIFPIHNFTVLDTYYPEFVCTSRVISN